VSTPQPPGPRSRRLGSAPERQSSTWQPWLYIRLAIVGLAIRTWSRSSSEQRPYQIDFVFANTKVQLIWALLLVLALGILFGVLLSQLYRNRRRAQLGKRAGKKADAPGSRRARQSEGKPS
jgi:hypothetical protein